MLLGWSFGMLWELRDTSASVEVEGVASDQVRAMHAIYVSRVMWLPG
jgi:hypothetical protein